MGASAGPQLDSIGLDHDELGDLGAHQIRQGTTILPIALMVCKPQVFGGVKAPCG